MIGKALSLYKKAYGGLSPGTWWLSLVMVVNRSGTMVIPFMTMYLTQHYGVTIGKAGFVMSLFGLGAIVGSLTGGKLVDTIGYYYVQLFALILGGCYVYYPGPGTFLYRHLHLYFYTCHIQ